ncbi:hypothetical protein [Mycoplasmopsis columbinasalis]|uniref:Uncharacterized protein n=1 Tax=Mycoplasmopsis columbinasalis TaxID=114880 RepID=A0A449B9S4_9BACT|nr:hypothetical protein [Mycoplasmopsis columbinasalis]VEU77918.1 Uncharacterised protein [Mycoplasmopsis columbinasalis]
MITTKRISPYTRRIETGKVIDITTEFVTVKAQKGIYTINRRLISDYAQHNNLTIFTPGELITFAEVSFDPATGRGSGNFKVLHPQFCKDPFAHNLTPTPKGFKNLLASVTAKFTKKD